MAGGYALEPSVEETAILRTLMQARYADPVGFMG
jgi:hypothetical protein